MPSALVNVRLDEDRLRKVRHLRARGIALSSVVRAAIDARFDALSVIRSGGDARAVVARIIAQHPDPEGFRPRAARDVHDGHAARRAIRKALRRAGR